MTDTTPAPDVALTIKASAPLAALKALATFMPDVVDVVKAEAMLSKITLLPGTIAFKTNDPQAPLSVVVEVVP